MVSSPLSTSNDSPKKLSPIQEYFKAPFKPERRDSPAHAMLHTEVFSIAPSKDFGKPPSIPKNPKDSIEKQQEFLSRLTAGHSLASSSHSTPSSCCSTNSSDAPVLPRRKRSIDSPDDDEE
jgi:hypothetical protein